MKHRIKVLLYFVTFLLHLLFCNVTKLCFNFSAYSKAQLHSRSVSLCKSEMHSRSVEMWFWQWLPWQLRWNELYKWVYSAVLDNRFIPLYETYSYLYLLMWMQIDLSSLSLLDDLTIKVTYLPIKMSTIEFPPLLQTNLKPT